MRGRGVPSETAGSPRTPSNHERLLCPRNALARQVPVSRTRVASLTPPELDDLPACCAMPAVPSTPGLADH